MTLSPHEVCYIHRTKLGEVEVGLSEVGLEDRYKLIGEAYIVGHSARRFYARRVERSLGIRAKFRDPAGAAGQRYAGKGSRGADDGVALAAQMYGENI